MRLNRSGAAAFPLPPPCFPCGPFAALTRGGVASHWKKAGHGRWLRFGVGKHRVRFGCICIKSDALFTITKVKQLLFSTLNLFTKQWQVLEVQCNRNVNQFGRGDLWGDQEGKWNTLDTLTTCDKMPALQKQEAKEIWQVLVLTWDGSSVVSFSYYFEGSLSSEPTASAMALVMMRCQAWMDL